MTNIPHDCNLSQETSKSKIFFGILFKKNALYDEVNNYIAITNEYNPYIFMNIDTLAAIGSKLTTTVVKYGINECTIAEYEGNKIFINNDLKFGEIEIR